jgi:hypothetical protein
MLAKLCAVCFVVLAASPLTAPFSTVGLGDFVSHGDTHHSGAATNTPQPSPAVQDQATDINEALVSLERSYVERSRRCAVTLAFYADATSVHLLSARFLPSASTVCPHNPSPIQTSLRI